MCGVWRGVENHRYVFPPARSGRSGFRGAEWPPGYAFGTWVVAESSMGCSFPGRSALEEYMAMDEVPALEIEQKNLFIGHFVIIIPHRFITIHFSIYVT